MGKILEIVKNLKFGVMLLPFLSGCYQNYQIGLNQKLDQNQNQSRIKICSLDYTVNSQNQAIQFLKKLGLEKFTEKDNEKCPETIEDIISVVDKNNNLYLSKEELEDEKTINKVKDQYQEKLTKIINDNFKPKFVHHRNYSFDWTKEYPYFLAGRKFDITPVTKFNKLYKRLLKKHIITENDLIVPPSRLSREDYLRVHSEKYLQRLEKFANSGLLHLGTFGNRFDETPVNDKILEFVEASVSGTYETAKLALKYGKAMNLSGGFHHAFPNHRGGFCYLNDVAVATKKLQAEDKVKKIMIVDGDVHNGNGNAFIFKDDASTYTFDIYQKNNYPYKEKQIANTNIALNSALPKNHPLYNRHQNPQIIGDEEYLKVLKEKLTPAIDQFKPDLIFYLNGADVLSTDIIGNFKLTKKGIEERDRYIITSARERNIPIAVVLAGGYSPQVKDVVDVHYNCAKIIATE